MSKKRKVYSAEFKSKLVLEVLEGELTLNEIASKYEILSNNLKNCKKQFLENMSLAFDKSAVVKEYKEEIAQLQKSSDALAKKVGTLTIERDWLEGKQGTPQKMFHNRETPNVSHLTHLGTLYLPLY